MLGTALKALAEPRRRDILRLLAVRELSAGDIAARFDVTRSAVSQHLGVLWASGLVHVRRDGARRLYSVRPEGLEELREFLSEFWTDSLTRLARAAEAEEKRTRDHSQD